MSSVPSSSCSYKEHDSAFATSHSDCGGFDRKTITAEEKLENRLHIKDLEQLKAAFMIEGDGYDNRLSLTREQFCEALCVLLNKGNKEEYGDLFDKIDMTGEGYVDWDKFASHMLLEFYERDDRVKATQIPQWKDLKNLPSPHKEIIQRVTFLKNASRYLAISKEGCISIWELDLKLQRTLKMTTESCRAKDIWVTHFVPLQNINKMALAYTSKEIAIYDLSNKLEFNLQFKVSGLKYTPFCLDYWYDPDDTNEALLVWGDVGGFVNVLHFTSANIALFERPPAPAGEKNETSLQINLNSVAKGTYKYVSYAKYQGHEDWVRQVKYSHYLECFISCSTTWKSAIVIGWLEKHASTGETLRKKDTGCGKQIQRKTIFMISQGVNSFDYNEQFNLIASAGVNNHVCLWNPYVISKPNGILRGHMASVMQVQFLRSRGQLISFSKDKVLRIWDIQLQVCIQRLAGMFPKGPEMFSTLFYDEATDNKDAEQNRSKLFITFSCLLTVIEIKPEIRNRVMSHTMPVIAALHNTVYNQIASLGKGGTLTIWMTDSGQKVKVINNLHGNAEVTCMSQDYSQTRLYIGSSDGSVRVWDFNGHCYHHLDCSGGQLIDLGQILILKRSIVMVGWAKRLTVFRNTDFKGFLVKPSEWKSGQVHTEDILVAAFTGPNTLATGAYNGEIVIWNTNSEQASKHLVQRSRQKSLPSREGVFITSREGTHASTGVFNSLAQESSQPDQNEFGWAVVKLHFLENRKTHSASDGANLVSCGGNGWVRFWNTSHNLLLGEFVAHKHAGSITMAIDCHGQYLVTGDLEGLVKVWEIADYCIHKVDRPIVDPPYLRSHFQPHQDAVNSLEVFERCQRTVILSASSDCSVALWDINGNKIGIFGQEEHWKIEPCVEPEIIHDNKLDQNVEEGFKMEDGDWEDNCSDWEPDVRAVTNPTTYRINTWDSTLLGKDYQLLGLKKRGSRYQPHTNPSLPYIFWEKTGQPIAGPFSALDTSELENIKPLTRPDIDRYFLVNPQLAEDHQKVPILAETLKAAFDEKSLFPKYVLESEMRMKTYHQMMLKQPQQSKFKSGNGNSSRHAVITQASQAKGANSVRKSNRFSKLRTTITAFSKKN